MAGLIPRPIRKLVFWLVIAAGLGLAGSAVWARWKLNALLADLDPGVRASSFGIVSSSSTPVKTAWPFTVRAAVKRQDAQNWLPDGDRGLVEKRYAWDPSAWAWVEDPPPPLSPQEQGTLVSLCLLMPGNLIDALKEANAPPNEPEKTLKAAHRREVASLALRISTGQDLGYRWDGSAAERTNGIAAWEKWWAENKVRYTKDRAGQVIGEIEKLFKGVQGPAPAPPK